MASSTNPRVRRINQLLRIKNTEALPGDYYYGKGTYGNAGVNRENWTPQAKDMHVNLELTQWNYNQYGAKDLKTLPSEDMNGTNKFKVGNNGCSQNLDIVDKTFQSKKADQFYQKQVRKHGMKPVTEIKNDVHGIRNHYPEFQNLIGHAYHNGPENMGVKYHPQNLYTTTYDLNHNHKYHHTENPGLFESQHLPLQRKLPGERGGSHDIRRTYNPAHVDEDFLPSWDLRQKDRPGTIGQFLMDSSQVKSYDQFQEVEQARRARSVHRDRYKTGVDNPEDALYTPAHKTSYGWVPPRHTNASKLMAESKAFDISKWHNRNIIKPKNTNPLYRNVDTKITNKRNKYPEVVDKDRSHLYIDGIDRSVVRRGSVQLRKSQAGCDGFGRRDRSRIEARAQSRGSVVRDESRDANRKEFAQNVDQKQLDHLNKKVMQKSIAVQNSNEIPQEEQRIDYGDY